MDIFDNFAQTVAACVRGATGPERKAIVQELREHLEDHAADLTERGYSDVEAVELAVKSMGDPKEIGRELDEKYPRIWKPLFYGFIVFLVIWLPFSLYFITSYASAWVTHVIDSAETLTDYSSYVSDDPDVIPLDAKIQVGDRVLRIYGMQYEFWYDDETPAVTLYPATYCTNIFSWKDASSLLNCEVYDDQGAPLTGGAAVIEGYPTPTFVKFPIHADTTSVTVVYDHYGYYDSVTIPIAYPGGEAS